MPRGPRDDAPGVVHHVMVRGIERRSIFRDDADREALLGRLSRLVPELGFRCFAWALMPNHLHLVLQSGPVRISRLMARVGTGYARYFNERHDRVGHLFQNRFRSRRVADDRDLVGLIVYVCRNPLEGGLVADATQLERFPWCGLGALLGCRAARAFESVARTLALFDSDLHRARRQLRVYVGAPAREPGTEPELAPSAHGVRCAAHERSKHDALGELVREICAASGLTPDDLRARERDRRVVAARAAVATRATRELGLGGSEVARALGVTPSGVSRMLKRAP